MMRKDQISAAATIANLMRGIAALGRDAITALLIQSPHRHERAMTPRFQSRSTWRSSGCRRLAARASVSPLVPELPELQEHRHRTRVVRQIGEGFAKARDHRWAGQSEEGVDLLLEVQRGDQRLPRVLLLHRRKHRLGLRVVRLAVQGEGEIARDVRSEEHTSELQSRFGISYAVF